MVEKEDGSYEISGLGDQDYIHVHKKLINPLDHNARIMMMGDDLFVHMNHIQLVTEVFDHVRHKLTRNHIIRKD